jgi:hypothetical protein
VGFDRVRTFATADDGWVSRVANLLVDGEGLRSPHAPSFAQVRLAC